VIFLVVTMGRLDAEAKTTMLCLMRKGQSKSEVARLLGVTEGTVRYGREDVIYNPIHYLPLIEQKINALDQAALLAEWHLPEEFDNLRRLMEVRMLKMGRREYVQVLRLLETFGFEDLHAAVKHALRLGAVSFDAVKHLLLCRIEKRPPKLDLDIYPYLPRANVATTSPASYMSLMTEAQS
jgi:hypothetical protein